MAADPAQNNPASDDDGAHDANLRRPFERNLGRVVVPGGFQYKCRFAATGIECTNPEHLYNTPKQRRRHEKNAHHVQPDFPKACPIGGCTAAAKGHVFSTLDA
eukprot:GABV01014279.1.p2 GENE.GABV01014279.1~~GABV01014279.1.p2  ORF type:complete len:103 (-),score=13.59 GABV01014279.1:3-311(-)